MMKLTSRISRKTMRRKIINCNNNCENIFVAFLAKADLRLLAALSTHTKIFNFLLQTSADFPLFPLLSLCFHQSTNENMCVFFCRKIFFFRCSFLSKRRNRKTRERLKKRVANSKNFSKRKREKYF